MRSPRWFSPQGKSVTLQCLTGTLISKEIYMKRLQRRTERGILMKKIILGACLILGIIAGVIIIWKLVLPFIDMIFQNIWSIMATLL